MGLDPQIVARKRSNAITDAVETLENMFGRNVKIETDRGGRKMKIWLYNQLIPVMSRGGYKIARDVRFDAEIPSNYPLNTVPNIYSNPKCFHPHFFLNGAACIGVPEEVQNPSTSINLRQGVLKAVDMALWKEGLDYGKHGPANEEAYHKVEEVKKVLGEEKSKKMVITPTIRQKREGKLVIS